MYPAGTVFFRQGDPPGNCFVVLSGKVSIFILTAEEQHHSEMHSPRDERRVIGYRPSVAGSLMSRNIGGSVLDHRTPSMIVNGEGARHRDSLASFSLANVSEEARELLRLQAQKLEEHVPLVNRKRTAEGFSFYHENSFLGTEVGQLGPGSLFGELALLDDTYRCATAKCCSDTEVLVIKRQDFDRTLKSEIQRCKEQAVAFLKEHVPGMLDVQTGKGKQHPSYYFAKLNFPRNHVFLRQGEPVEETIWVLEKGSVEFIRSDTLPPADFGRPCSSGSRPGTPASLFTSSGSRPSSRASSRSSSRLPRSRDTEVEMWKVCVLRPGAVFGSLPTMGAPEPFTVRASSEITVFQLTVDAISKIPRNMLNTMRDYLMRSTMLHLDNLRQHRKHVGKGVLAALRGETTQQEEPIQAARAVQLKASNPLAQLLQGQRSSEGAGLRGAALRASSSTGNLGTGTGTQSAARGRMGGAVPSTGSLPLPAPAESSMRSTASGLRRPQSSSAVVRPAPGEKQRQPPLRVLSRPQSAASAIDVRVGGKR
jgi:CRP-like cAMP-binding protein